MTPLAKALAEHRKATENLAKTVADAWANDGAPPKHIVEALELLRYQLHRGLDDLIDEEELRRPSAGNAWRAQRYRELTVPAA